MLLRGGEILAKCLKSYGVECVFGLPGHGNIGLVDGFIKEEIPYLMCHHETIAGMTADGYYRATHRPGVVCLTCTPGALNAQLAIATAAQDCSRLCQGRRRSSSQQRVSTRWAYASRFSARFTRRQFR